MCYREFVLPDRITAHLRWWDHFATSSGKTQPFSILMGLKLCSLLSPEVARAAVRSFQCVWKELKNH